MSPLRHRSITPQVRLPQARLVGLVLAASVVLFLAVPVTASAEPTPSSTPDQQAWVTNGTVRAICTAPDGTAYIGGDFDYVGPNTGNGAALDATSGARDTAFPQVNGTVHAAVSDGAGGYYIGGHFTQVGSFSRNDIAHILADGSVDPAFDPNADSVVEALAVSGSTVYAGGDFANIGGQARSYIAALDATTGLATAWDPNADGEVEPRPLCLGFDVYAGGEFTSIGGQTRLSLAALDATTGLAASWKPSPGGAVYALAVRARSSTRAATSARLAANPAVASPPWTRLPVRDELEPQRERRRGCPGRLGLDCLRWWQLLGYRRADAQRRRGPGRDHRARHGVESPSQQPCPRPRRFGLDHLRRRRFHRDRRAELQPCCRP